MKTQEYVNSTSYDFHGVLPKYQLADLLTKSNQLRPTFANLRDMIYWFDKVSPPQLLAFFYRQYLVQKFAACIAILGLVGICDAKPDGIVAEDAARKLSCSPLPSYCSDDLNADHPSPPLFASPWVSTDAQRKARCSLCNTVQPAANNHHGDEKPAPATPDEREEAYARFLTGMATSTIKVIHLTVASGFSYLAKQNAEFKSAIEASLQACLDNHKAQLLSVATAFEDTAFAAILRGFGFIVQVAAMTCFGTLLTLTCALMFPDCPLRPLFRDFVLSLRGHQEAPPAPDRLELA
jgi:hypothetical protein